MTSGRDQFSSYLNRPKMPRRGHLTVFMGCMFAGKSVELVSRADRYRRAKKMVLVFRHKIDTRYGENSVNSHNGLTTPAIEVRNSGELMTHVLYNITQQGVPRVVCIDEVQFFDEGIVEAVEVLLELGVRVFVAGLDLDFKKDWFGSMPELMKLATSIKLLTAICECGKIARYTQRLVNGEPASRNAPVIVVGADSPTKNNETYVARCPDCYQLFD